jgi:ubiquinone biosynthesis protein UbiJ
MLSHPFTWLGPLVLPRLTLLLNHVVSSEPVASGKLQPHAGRTIDLRWTSTFSPPLPRFLLPADGSQGLLPPSMRFVITPAGLFELLESGETLTPSGDGLTLTIELSDPLTMARQLLTGQRPDVRIEGDAALAEVASWLMNHLRWDIQDDVARLLGNAPAEWLRTMGDAVRQALQRWRPGQGSDAGSSSASRH